MQLLPGDKIFVATHTSISLYDTSTIEATANIPPASTWPHSRPTWLSEGELLIFPRNPGLSQLYHCCNTNEFRLIFSTTEAVYGITIPRQSGQVESEPELVELRDPHNLNIIWGDRTYFGYNTAVVIYSDACIKMLYYSWPEGFSESPCGPSNSLVGKVDKTWRSPEHSAFDESSGRVVVDTGNRLVVYDFDKFKNVFCM